MTPELLFTLAAEFAQATGNSDRFRVLGSMATNDNDRVAHAGAAARWEALASSRREELRAALRETLRGTVRAVPDDELPVATTQRGRIEVRATIPDGTRTVRVRYTPAQALETGAALIACAALMDDRIGGTLTRTLAALPSHLDTGLAPTEPTNEEPAGEKPTAEQPTGGGREIRDA